MLTDKGTIRCDALKPSKYDARQTGLTLDRIISLRDRFNLPALLASDIVPLDIYRIVRTARSEMNIQDRELAAIWAVIELGYVITKDPLGLQQPISYLTAPGPAGEQNEVCSGMRRWFGHVIAGHETIRAVPVWYPTLADRLRAELADNLSRNDLTDPEMLLLLKRLQDELDEPISVRRIASKTGKSQGTAQQIQRILREGTPELFDMLRDGYLTSINAAFRALDQTPEIEEKREWFARSFITVDIQPGEDGFVLLMLSDMVNAVETKSVLAADCDLPLREEINDCVTEVRHLLFEQRQLFRLSGRVNQQVIQYIVDRVLYCQKRCSDQMQNLVDSVMLEREGAL